MKIALACPASLPATQFGGILFLCVQLARELSKIGHDVTIYTTDLDFADNDHTFNRELPRLEKIENFKIKRSHVFARMFLYYVNPEMFFQLRDDKPDIIHSFGIRSFQSLVCAIISRLYKIPLVISDQSGLSTHPNLHSSLSRQFLYKLQNPMVRYIVKQAKRISVANEYELDIFSEFGNVSKSAIIRNGINLDEIQKNQIDFKSKNNISGRIILFVGRFAESKGIDVLLHAFSIIANKSELKDVKLVIIGADFGYQNKMLALIDELKIDQNTIVMANLKRDEVISAYDACEFLVLPSIWELSPLVPLEAFAFKKSVISTNVHGIPYTLTDKKNAILIDPNNPIQLADSITILLTDENMRCQLGEAGYRFVHEIANSQMMAMNTLKMYESILKEENIEANILINSSKDLNK